MSAWRREASQRLPELQRIIASQLVDGPMMLWIELNTEFTKLCELDPPPVDLLRRIWQYCDWCLLNGGDELRTAAALGFGEHLIDTPQRAALLPQIMAQKDYLALRNLMEYHHSPEDVDEWLQKLWPGPKRRL